MRRPLAQLAVPLLALAACGDSPEALAYDDSLFHSPSLDEREAAIEELTSTIELPSTGTRSNPYLVEARFDMGAADEATRRFRGDEADTLLQNAGLRPVSYSCDGSFTAFYTMAGDVVVVLTAGATGSDLTVAVHYELDDGVSVPLEVDDVSGGRNRDDEPCDWG